MRLFNSSHMVHHHYFLVSMQEIILVVYVIILGKNQILARKEHVGASASDTAR